MGNNRGVSIAASQGDRLESFADGPDLVDLNKDGVAYALLNTPLQPFRVGHEQIIAHQLYFVAQLPGEELPTGPIVFGQSVFKRNDGVLPYPVLPQTSHLFPGLLPFFPLLYSVSPL